MLYAAVRPLAKLGLQQYFRRIDLAGLENIPEGVPVILAANHPTAFLEPCIMACFSGHTLNFLVRGDMFRKGIHDWLLRSLNMLPIFRIRDGGYVNLKQNYATFAACNEALAKNKTIMILAEGRCIHEKRLRPIRKGTARVALGALESGKVPEVYIVPVGVNYTYAERVRGEVLIRCGRPLRISDYWAEYQEQPNRAISRFTDDLRERLKQELIIIERPADETLVEPLLQMYRTEHPSPRHGFTRDDRQLRGEQALASTINTMPEAEKAALNEMVNAYFTRLTLLRLNDAALAGRYRPRLKQTNRLVAELLPALLLGLLNLPPLALAQIIAGTKVKTVEFESSVRWAAALGGYMVYALLGLLTGFLTGLWWVALLPFLAALGLPWWLRYLERTQEWLLAYRVRRQTPADLTILREQRQRILVQVEALRAGALLHTDTP